MCYNVYKEKMFTIELEDGRERFKSLVMVNLVINLELRIVQTEVKKFVIFGYKIVIIRQQSVIPKNNIILLFFIDDNCFKNKAIKVIL